MEKYLKTLKESGKDHEVIIHQGTARSVILKVADDLNVDFVVLGCRGLGALQR